MLTVHESVGKAQQCQILRWLYLKVPTSLLTIFMYYSLDNLPMDYSRRLLS